MVLLWTPWGKDPHTFWGCNCSFWSWNCVPVLLLTSFWRSFLFLHSVLLSTVQGQVAPQHITTGQNFLFWLLHSSESNCYQNKNYGDLKITATLSAERPLFEMCVIGRDLIYVASVVKTCNAAVRVSPAGKTSQDFPSSALFSCHEVWFPHVRSVANNISKYQTPTDSSTL